jgi:regulator of protease activity HflC (stomatin/prohibitin superfamily)
VAIDLNPVRLLRNSGVLLALLALVFTASCAVTTINTGHVGVTTLFGAVTGERLGEGLHLINPMKRVTEISIRTQEIKEQAEVPSSEGLIMHLETSVLYRPDSERITDLFQKVGRNYTEVLLIPNLRSVMRQVTAAHTAATLYSEGRERVAAEMLQQMRHALEPRGIVVENVLLRDIQLPATLRAAIEAKQQADQEAQRMGFVLQRERQEAERKRIEAQGVADFQRIVSAGISRELLEWKGIEATVELAKTGNSKVVVIGNPKNGLPLILPSQ